LRHVCHEDKKGGTRKRVQSHARLGRDCIVDICNSVLTKGVPKLLNLQRGETAGVQKKLGGVKNKGGTFGRPKKTGQREISKSKSMEGENLIRLGEKKLLRPGPKRWGEKRVKATPARIYQPDTRQKTQGVGNKLHEKRGQRGNKKPQVFKGDDRWDEGKGKQKKGRGKEVDIAFLGGAAEKRNTKMSCPSCNFGETKKPVGTGGGGRWKHHGTRQQVQLAEENRKRQVGGSQANAPCKLNQGTTPERNIGQTGM